MQITVCAELIGDIQRVVFQDNVVIDLEKREPILLDKPGIYHFQYDTLIKEGLTLFRFEEDFPRLTSAG